jgi:hypothetical protein
MPGQDVSTYIGSKMVVADELWHSWKRLGRRREERGTQVMDDGQGPTPVPAYILQHRPDFILILRADPAALQDLAAERIHAEQQHLAWTLTGAVDVQDVAAPISHGGSQEARTLFMNDLEVGHELSGQVTDRTLADLNHTGSACKPDVDLVALATFDKPRKTHMRQDVVRNLRPRGHDPVQFRRSRNGHLRMFPAKAFMCDGYHDAVAKGNHCPFPRGTDRERFTTDGATSGIPSERDSGLRQRSLPTQVRDLLLLQA